MSVPLRTLAARPLQMGCRQAGAQMGRRQAVPREEKVAGSVRVMRPEPADGSRGGASEPARADSFSEAVGWQP